MRDMQVSNAYLILHPTYIPPRLDLILTWAFYRCRTRRVKCDERKPACFKCSTSRRICEGYADPFRSSMQLTLPTAQSSNPSSCGLETSPDRDLQMSSHSALGSSFNSCDRQFFEYFRQTCVHDLVSPVEIDFWNHYVLQISASKPAVQYAILALSAQHQAFLMRELRKDDKCGSEGVSCAIYSWRQYSKATTILQRQINSSPRTAATMEETLIICLLFIASEVLQGNYSAALTHLEGGLEILSNCEPSTVAGNDLSTSSLAKVFKRLDIQASSYVGGRNVKPFSFNHISSQSSIPTLPSRHETIFIDVCDAFDSLNRHIAAVYHFMRSPTPSLRHDPQYGLRCVMDFKYEPLLHPRTENNSNFSGLFEKQRELVDALRSWALAFEAFIEKSSFHVSHPETGRDGVRMVRDSQQYAVLWTSYLIIVTTLSTCLEPDECSYDMFLPEFQSIVEHAEFVLLSNVQDDPNSTGRTRFSIEMTVIQPLYFTALKCRKYNLRHRAISLLHISGQEGVWDGKMLAVIAKYIVEHEEYQGIIECLPEQGQISELPSDADNESLVIPEFARVHGVTLENVDRRNRKVWIEYSKRNFNTEEKGRRKSDPQAYEWILLREFLEW